MSLRPPRAPGDSPPSDQNGDLISSNRPETAIDANTTTNTSQPDRAGETQGPNESAAASTFLAPTVPRTLDSTSLENGRQSSSDRPSQGTAAANIEATSTSATTESPLAPGSDTAASGPAGVSSGASTQETLGAASVDIPPATATSETGDGGDNAGAIVITVNYMFMEGTDQANPGRTGSLVVTLPNNATNREPRIILQFISLATRMAYSALVTNAPKVHRGVTLDKFQSFAVKNATDLADTVCSICFEQYDMKEEVAPIPDISLETVASKKRKLGIDSHCVSASSSTERLPEAARAVSANADSATIPAADSTPSATNSGPSADTETSSSAAPASNDSEEPPQKYLCEHDEEYGHLPLQMPCGHIFGQSCLCHWLKENITCPLCRVSVGDESRQRHQFGPISYIRFGGLNDLGDGSATTANADGGDATPDDSGPGFFDRAALALFNSLLTLSREAPPLPLVPDRTERRNRNSSVAPVIDNILSYFGRARRQREADNSGATSLFASGVASRRTENGVQTVASDQPFSFENFHDFTSLTGHHGSDPTEENRAANGSGNGNDASRSSDDHNDSDEGSHDTQ